VAGRGSSTKLALLGGTPVRDRAWPQWPARGAEEERALIAALRDGDWGGFPLPNQRSSAFAAAFAERHDCEHALCVANGTVSLEVALQAMGVEPGAEVIFSFQTSKLMTAGEGGIVTTSDDALLDRLHALVNCGRQRPGAAEPAAVIGHNYRMTDLQAAILEVQLGRLDEQHLVRGRNASRLRAAIEDIDGLTNLRIDDRVTTQAIYQFVFRFDHEAFAGVDRDVFVAALQAEGVPADGRFYESLPVSELLRPDPARYPAWSAAATAAPAADCPNAEHVAYRESVWLPHQLLLGTEGDVDDIVEAVLKVQKAVADLAGLKSAEVQRLRQARSAR